MEYIFTCPNCTKKISVVTTQPYDFGYDIKCRKCGKLNRIINMTIHLIVKKKDYETNTKNTESDK